MVKFCVLIWVFLILFDLIDSKIYVISDKCYLLGGLSKNFRFL